MTWNRQSESGATPRSDRDLESGASVRRSCAVRSGRWAGRPILRLFWVVSALMGAGGSSSAQSVLFAEDFDRYERGQRPEGWTYTPGWLHTPQPLAFTRESRPGIPESEQWAETGNPYVDWQVLDIKTFSLLTPLGDTEATRFYWCKYVLGRSGNPLLDVPISPVMPSTRDVFNSPQPQTQAKRLHPDGRHGGQWGYFFGGSPAPWIKQPYPDLGCDLVTGEVSTTNKLLNADSDEYGDINMNSGIVTPEIPLQGARWVRIDYKSMTAQNQDDGKGAYYQIDDGPWMRLQRFSVQQFIDDVTYYGDYSFCIDTQGGNTLRIRWWMAGRFSWYWAIDDLEVKGYDGIPADGPA